MGETIQEYLIDIKKSWAADLNLVISEELTKREFLKGLESDFVYAVDKFKEAEKKRLTKGAVLLQYSDHHKKIVFTTSDNKELHVYLQKGQYEKMKNIIQHATTLGGLMQPPAKGYSKEGSP